MASAVSASASGQDFPASRIIQAFTSNRRRRMISAARNATSARSAAGTFFQLSNACQPASSACTASSDVAFWNFPITSLVRAGFTESKVAPAWISFPPMRRGYSRPSCARAAARASSWALRFSGLVKSVKGSFRNSGLLMALVSSSSTGHPRGRRPARGDKDSIRGGGGGQPAPARPEARGIPV